MTIIVHEWDEQQKCKRCCVPKDTASKPQLCPGRPPSARQAARMRWPLDGADAQALEGALTLTEKERDEARAAVERAERRLDLSLRAWDAAGGTREGMFALICEHDEGRERERLAKEIERTQRLLDHATQENPGTSVLVMLMNEAREARAEAAALRAHFDAAAPEHNLPALLDLYDNRRAAAESERDEARAEVERLRGALCSISEGFDGALYDTSAKQVDGYYRGVAVSALQAYGRKGGVK